MLTFENYRDFLSEIHLNKINYLHKEEGMFIDQMLDFINEHSEEAFLLFYDNKFVFFRESGVDLDFTNSLKLHDVKFSISSDEMEDLYLSVVNVKDPLFQFELKESVLRWGMKYQEYCDRNRGILIKEFVGSYDQLITFVDEISHGQYLNQPAIC